MGEAKRRKNLDQQIQSKMSGIAFGRVANAINKLTQAASKNVGSDCVLQAALAKVLLHRLGVPSEVCYGYAAWRVGDGDGDVISHIPSDAAQAISPRHIAFHAWVKVRGHIFDVTTGQLRLKAAQLDALDGGKTSVEWAPEYLLADRKAVSSYEEVRIGRAGLFFYHEDPKLKAWLEQSTPLRLDASDVESAWLIYQSPSMVVVGPNDMP